MFQNIPAELRSLNQWLVWRYIPNPDPAKKPTKVPYSVHTGNFASVNEASTWSSFDQAIAAVNNRELRFDGIGFVFTQNDPYAGIDLDDASNFPHILDRQKKIFDVFDSYSELSPSNKGLHIIVKGHVAAGRKREHIEVYSWGRFFTMTGNVYRNVPIAERQGYLQILWNELGRTAEIYDASGTPEQTIEDRDIYLQAVGAANGDKFLRLWRGEWETFFTETGDRLYPSQSEADQALVDIIQYYTKNRNQIRNLFLASKLGERPKAKRIDYVERMITKSFDKEVPLVDLAAVKARLNDRMQPPDAGMGVPASGFADTAVQAAPSPVSQRLMPVNPVSFHGPALPPGLTGEIARFIYAAAPRPIPEVALMAAIGLMAGICGRSWNISGTGLNQYLLLVAKTGRGKEAMSSGIDKLIYGAVRQRIPSIAAFIGPGSIQSGQALVKYINSTSPCFVSIVAEFDKFLAAISSFRANSALVMLRQNILDLYAKSGYNQSFRPMIYSEKEKNTQTVMSPAFSILGECTPEKFYELLDENLISEGLLPRFTVIEYHGDRPQFNKAAITIQPDESLVDGIVNLAQTSLTLMKGSDGLTRVVNIPLDDDAQAISDDLDKFCDDEINTATRDIYAQLWNRAHLKFLRLSGLIAVGCNPFHPIVNREIAEWSRAFVERDVRGMLYHWDAGEVGSDDARQVAEMRKVIAEYMTEQFFKFGKYGVPQNLHAAHIIPYRYLNKRLSAVACFRKDRLGSTSAIKRGLGHLLETAEIVEVNRDQLVESFQTAGRAFVIKEMLI